MILTEIQVKKTVKVRFGDRQECLWPERVALVGFVTEKHPDMKYELDVSDYLRLGKLACIQ